VNDAWPWILTIVGCVGFKLAGAKVWWAWYINIGNQILWAAYAVVTEQWGFLLGIPIYLSVFVPNAIRWTREHRVEESFRVYAGAPRKRLWRQRLP
jgi:hypothetical protein